MFPLICTWINGWANNRDAGHLRHHHPHHDVIVMNYLQESPKICLRHSNIHMHSGPWFNIKMSSYQYRRSHCGDKMAVLMTWGEFQEHLWDLELLNLRALKFSLWIESTSFNVWTRYFVWNFNGFLWNSTQNILCIHWKIQFQYNIEILRALGFKSSLVFLKWPPGQEKIPSSPGMFQFQHQKG